MHERAVMDDLMRAILSAAEGEETSRVVGISVWLGALSHMTPHHFGEHFEQVAAGTIAEGARLDIVTSDDIHHAQATGVVLKGVDVETRP